MDKVNRRFKFDVNDFEGFASFGSAYLTFSSWLQKNVGNRFASSVKVDRKPRCNPYSRKNIAVSATGLRQREEYYISGGRIDLIGFVNPLNYSPSNPSYKKVEWERTYNVVIQFVDLDERVANAVEHIVNKIFVKN